MMRIRRKGKVNCPVKSQVERNCERKGESNVSRESLIT